MNKAAELLVRMMQQNALDAAWTRDQVKSFDEAKIARLEEEIDRLNAIIWKYRNHHYGIEHDLSDRS